MGLTSRQTVVLLIGLILAVALVAFGLTNPGCANTRELEGVTYCLNKTGTIHGVRNYGSFYFLGAATVGAIAIILALSPWGRRRA